MADTLGSFEQAVLLAIVRLGADAYGRSILHDVESRFERTLAPGAVHSTLDRLETKRLVDSRLVAGTPVRGGRARRYYRIKPAGVQSLNVARATLETLWRGLEWPLARAMRALP